MNKPTKLNALAKTKVRCLSFLTHPSALMLQMATHKKTHTETHAAACLHWILPVHSQTDRQLPMLIKRNNTQCTGGIKLIEECL